MHFFKVLGLKLLTFKVFRVILSFKVFHSFQGLEDPADNDNPVQDINVIKSRSFYVSVTETLTYVHTHYLLFTDFKNFIYSLEILQLQLKFQTCNTKTQTLPNLLALMS